MQPTTLPRSRALVRLDGPGHIMPVEPVTPPGSRVWRIVHSPLMLVVIAVGLLILAGIALNLVGVGLRFVNYFRGFQYIIPVVSAAAMMAAYLIFVRFVERRRDVDEFGARGWLTELALGFAGGFALVSATFAILFMAGALRVTGFNPLSVMPLQIVTQFCAAVILETALRGFFFRQAERLLGSWIALLLTVIAFAAVALFREDGAPLAMLADGLDAGLLFTVVYMVTRRLWAAIGAHAAWNLGHISLYGASASPSGPRGLVLSQVYGPDWLTGGSIGAYASVPSLILSVLLVAALLVIAVRRQHIVRPAWQRGRAGKRGLAEAT